MEIGFNQRKEGSNERRKQGRNAYTKTWVLFLSALMHRAAVVFEAFQFLMTFGPLEIFMFHGVWIT